MSNLDGECVRSEKRYTASRDPDDNIVLATAASGGAKYLITNDRDLLDLPHGFQRTKTKPCTTREKKAIRDHQWEISSALREGEQRGALMGKIELLQGILGINATDQQTLRGMTTQQLEAPLSELQQSVRNRPPD